MTDETLCLRCGQPLAVHEIIHDGPTPDDAFEGEFDVPTSGLLCPRAITG